MHRHNVPAARHLREHQTPSEELLWSALRRKQLGGWKFRRQHPIGPFVLDFYCPQARLCVEVDGAVHANAEQREHDTVRETFLRARGIEVLRVRAQDVEADVEAVVVVIGGWLRVRPSPPAPPPS